MIPIKCLKCGETEFFERVVHEKIIENFIHYKEWGDTEQLITLYIGKPYCGNCRSYKIELMEDDGRE